MLVIDALHTHCGLSDVEQEDSSTLLRVGGASGSTSIYYRHDPRVRTLDNTLGAPAAFSATSLDGQSCPTAPKSFVNSGACQLVAACSPFVYSSAPLTLNAESLRTFYTSGGMCV